MPKGLVVYTTRYGNTEKATVAICEGLREGGLEADCKNAKELRPRDLAAYDIIIFGAPTHAENIPEEMRKFMDALKRVGLKGKKGAAFDTRYEDAEVGALTVMERYMKDMGIAIIHSGLAVLLPAGAARGPLKEGELTRCKEFGKAIAQKAE